ncbi:hypothetical protein [Commensalibacter papalotli (ex Botero et al. 2024)]|uniref:Peptidase S1 domain-containing protein n=1 Tax=Commensalibacter papalotli (ex Botero et al. 2024) TaxID=2972766 RepID=A0ABN8WFG0_9PROT|nr:hypothetical protein [Commensalibacter papalotli (ex Botero et al. 2024)]CAI3944796.1 unnamed protein product [Commensalibacter papalotli (ex Botero et al. 2024)]
MSKLYNSFTQITIQSKPQIHTEDKYLRFLSGTGFFIYCPPYENDIFFVTANHCLREYDKNSEKSNKMEFQGNPEIYYTLCGKPSDPTINFIDFLEYSSDSSSDIDDILIGIIDKSDFTNYSLLKQRALKLINQDNINNILMQKEGNFIAIGYPKTDSKILHDENWIIAQPKRLLGKFRKTDKQHYYEIYDTNWEGKSLNGFSGSPVIYDTDKKQEPILLGIITNQKRFLSTNLVTDTITQYLYNGIK